MNIGAFKKRKITLGLKPKKKKKHFTTILQVKSDTMVWLKRQMIDIKFKAQRFMAEWMSVK